MNTSANAGEPRVSGSSVYSSNKTESPIQHLSAIIDSVLLSSIRITNLQLLKISIALLGALILLLHIVPLPIILIVLLILFIIFTIIYVIVYGYRFSVANKPINISKLQNFRNDFSHNAE